MMPMILRVRGRTTVMRLSGETVWMYFILMCPALSDFTKRIRGITRLTIWLDNQDKLPIYTIERQFIP